ncbi:hypothetical protein BJY04DRAFT_103156 [Aspergillus karnatakaensis]|uniref:uncharacterized protein n=1 Tax=Aspergillus karnatakaensis TaxID=1810916 RepID=UPI003CCD8FD0
MIFASCASRSFSPFFYIHTFIHLLTYPVLYLDPLSFVLHHPPSLPTSSPSHTHCVLLYISTGNDVLTASKISFFHVRFFITSAALVVSLTHNLVIYCTHFRQRNCLIYT